MSIVNEFKSFILRGNVVDLAVGIVIGAAFGTLVTSFVKDFVTPLVAVLANTSKSGLVIHVGPASLLLGDFLDALIAFVLVALVVFFFVVKPVNWLISLHRTEPTPDPSTRKCPECLGEIPVAARRCMYCTSEVAAA